MFSVHACTQKPAIAKFKLNPTACWQPQTTKSLLVTTKSLCELRSNLYQTVMFCGPTKFWVNASVHVHNPWSQMHCCASPHCPGSETHPSASSHYPWSEADFLNVWPLVPQVAGKMQTVRQFKLILEAKLVQKWHFGSKVSEAIWAKIHYCTCPHCP